MTGEEYPALSDSLVRKTYPVQKAAAQSGIPAYDGKVTSEFLYRIQLAVFHAKMDLLNFILESGHVPASDEAVEVEIRVSRRTIDSEATDGEWITLPVDLHYLETIKYERPW